MYNTLLKKLNLVFSFTLLFSSLLGEEAKNGPYAEFDADRFGQQFNKKPEYHHENFAGSSQNTYSGFDNDESTTDEPGSEEYEHNEENASQSFTSTAAGGEDPENDPRRKRNQHTTYPPEPTNLGEQTNLQLGRGIRKLQRRMKEHEEKLEVYKKNPFDAKR